MEKRAKELRLRKHTTPEDLANEWNTVIKYKDLTILAGYYYTGEKNFFAAVYEFETCFETVEDRVELIDISEEQFEDEGSAIEWAITKWRR